MAQRVAGAQQRPFACDLVEPSYRELSEASGLFDLSEGRFVSQEG